MHWALAIGLTALSLVMAVFAPLTAPVVAVIAMVTNHRLSLHRLSARLANGAPRVMFWLAAASLVFALVVDIGFLQASTTQNDPQP